MGLNTNQKAAVEYLDGPLLVLAGPGTGKTQLLSHKVAYILEHTDASPDNILCLTFTESGASNMRERLKSIIKKDAFRVTIGTYHAFGTEILSAYKNYSADYNRRLDNSIDEVEQFKIIKNIQDHLAGTDILRGDSIKDIISTISSAKAANLTATNLAQIAEQNIADSAVISSAISPLLQKVVPYKFLPSLEQAYRPIYEILKSYTDIPPILKNIDRNIKSLAKSLETAIAEAEDTGKIPPLTKWRDAFFEKDAAGNWRLKDQIANKKLMSLANIMAQYDQYLKDNGLYDYDDMIIEAANILKNDTGFRLTLSEKYQYILLDEFQDTNPAQFAIIKQLTAYEKPLIMAVGDDDQAIYEFQGASATNLKMFEQHYGAHVVKLTENYRSTQEILDFAHRIIIQADDRFDDKNLTAHQPAPDHTAIERHEFISSDLEYSYVAERISGLIADGVPQTSIAIIAPKHKYLIPLLPYLKSYDNINIAYEKRDNLLEDPSILPLIKIAKFVYSIAASKPTDTSIFELLTYDFWQNISPLQVIKLTDRAKTDKKSALDYLLASEDTNIRQVTEFLVNLAAVSFEAPLELFFSYLIGTTQLRGFTSPFLNYYSTNPESFTTFEVFEHLATLRSKLDKHFANRSPKLKDFIELITDYESADFPIQSTSPYRDSADAVQVLSSHKAKGLEFEYVFIVATDNGAWGKSQRNNNHLTLPDNLTQIRHTGITDSERLRLLYVAVTRAKRNLIITNSLKDFSGGSHERLAYLEEHQDETGAPISPFLPDPTIHCHYEELDAARKLASVRHWIEPFITPDPDMRAKYHERLANYYISASAVTRFIDLIYAGPQEFFKSAVLNTPQTPATEPMIYGNLLHHAFERVTNAHFTDEQAVEYLLNDPEFDKADPIIAAKLRDKAPRALLINLQVFGEILRNPNSRAEVSSRDEHPMLDDILLVGVIDHINIDEAAKTIEIYDFKTSAYDKGKWRSNATLYKYMLQLGFYKLLLNRSPKYTKYTVTRGHILFVNPDKNDQVYDKPYDFNAEDEAELITLIKVIYAQTRSLAFLDDPELFLPADPTNKLADIQNFIQLLIDKTELQ